MYDIFITATATVYFPKLPTDKRDEIVKKISEIFYVHYPITCFKYNDEDCMSFETDLDLLKCTYDECGIDEVDMDTEYIEKDIYSIIMEVAGEDAYLDSTIDFDFDEDWVKEKIKEVEEEYWR